MDGENNGKMENPIKMDDLGVALFLETPKMRLHLVPSSRSNQRIATSTEVPLRNPLSKSFNNPRGLKVEKT